MSKILDQMYQIFSSGINKKIKPLLTDIFTLLAKDTKDVLGTMKAPVDLSPLLKQLDQALSDFESWKLYDSILFQFYSSIYSFIDETSITIFVQKPLLHCNADRGFHLKFIISRLDTWRVQHLKKFTKPKKILLRFDFEEMSELANLLVLDKNLFSDKDLIKSLFQKLTLRQLHYFLNHFKPTASNPQPVPTGILEKMKTWETIEEVKFKE